MLILGVPAKVQLGLVLLFCDVAVVLSLMGSLFEGFSLGGMVCYCICRFKSGKCVFYTLFDTASLAEACFPALMSMGKKGDAGGSRSKEVRHHPSDRQNT